LQSSSYSSFIFVPLHHKYKGMTNKTKKEIINNNEEELPSLAAPVAKCYQSNVNITDVDAQNVPLGNSKEDIRVREKLIKDFYAKWISQHPDKKVWNKNLGAFINVKFLSINETYEKASRNHESTRAVFRLSEILEGAVLVSEKPAKRNSRNQKQFEKLLMMKYGEVKLVVGLQRSNQDLVQYCITVPTLPQK
jgi:hypothetical protein